MTVVRGVHACLHLLLFFFLASSEEEGTESCGWKRIGGSEVRSRAKKRELGCLTPGIEKLNASSFAWSLASSETKPASQESASRMKPCRPLAE